MEEGVGLLAPFRRSAPPLHEQSCELSEQEEESEVSSVFERWKAERGREDMFVEERVSVPYTDRRLSARLMGEEKKIEELITLSSVVTWITIKEMELGCSSNVNVMVQSKFLPSTVSIIAI